MEAAKQFYERRMEMRRDRESLVGEQTGILQFLCKITNI